MLLILITTEGTQEIMCRSLADAKAEFIALWSELYAILEDWEFCPID
jgi:hypothetical protein